MTICTATSVWVLTLFWGGGKTAVATAIDGFTSWRACNTAGEQFHKSDRDRGIWQSRGVSWECTEVCK